MKNFVITFANSHHAIKANIRLNSLVEVIPTPREISSECGFSLLAKKCELQVLKQKLADQSLKYAKIYKIETRKGAKIYEEIS
jgi:hypothetical protein